MNSKFVLRGFRRRHFKRETRFKTVIAVLRQAFGTRLYLRKTLLEMAFRNGLCKLPMPTDMDESEIILSRRQRLIEQNLLKCCIRSSIRSYMQVSRHHKRNLWLLHGHLVLLHCFIDGSVTYRVHLLVNFV